MSKTAVKGSPGVPALAPLSNYPFSFSRPLKSKFGGYCGF